jgi:hypothetical protein
MDSVATVIDSASRIPAEIAFLIIAAVLGTGFSLVRGKGRAVSLTYALLIGTSFHMVARQSLAGHGIMTAGLISVVLYVAAVLAAYFLIERFIHGEFSFSSGRKIAQTVIMGIGFAAAAAYAFLVIPGLRDFFDFTGAVTKLSISDTALALFVVGIAAPSVARVL